MRSPTGVSRQARRHFWAAVPLHVQIWSLVPSALLLLGTSTHLFASTDTRSPAPLSTNFWAALPLQFASWSAVPSAVAAHATSMHLPPARTVPSASNVQRCALDPLHVHSWRRLPSLKSDPGTSMHLPASPTSALPDPPPVVTSDRP